MLRYKTETRPGLVALYNIRPENGAGQFLQPRTPHGAHTRIRNIQTACILMYGVIQYYYINMDSHKGLWLDLLPCGLYRIARGQRLLSKPSCFFRAFGFRPATLPAGSTDQVV